MSIERIEKLRNEIERLEEEYDRANFGNMFDKSKQDSLYKKLRKKRKELKELEESSPGTSG
jgi:hypothetical protein